jgi:AraC-like DNA-binding protein
LRDRPPLEELRSRDVTDGHLDIPPSLGRGDFKIFHLPNGCALFLGSHRFLPGHQGRLVTLGEVTIEPPQPFFTAQIVRGGRVMHDEVTAKASVIFDDEHDLFCHFESRKLVPRVDAVGSDMVALTAPIPALQAMLGAELASRLLDGLGVARPLAVAIRKTSSAFGDALLAAATQPMDSPIARLSMQARVLDALSALATHVTGGPRAVSDLVVPQRAHALRERLLRLEGKLPTLTELAAEHGCSARTLNAEFLRVYGESITEFMLRNRLEAAHEVLRTSDVPMKVLADRLGYSHVNHFIHAFKRRFGYPPGHVRRG